MQDIRFPSILRASDEDVSRWVQDGVSYEELRDKTLFDFQNKQDIRLFEHLVVNGLNMMINVCLGGNECGFPV